MGLAELFTVLWVVVFNYGVAFFRIFFPRPRKSIEGEVALITGAGHGIGRELALELSKLGAITVLWDINQENVDKVKQEIISKGGKAHSYVCDVRTYGNVSRVAEEVRKDVGEVDILVNNAGILNGGWLLDLSQEDIKRTFEVNTLAHFWTVKKFLPAMIKNKKGHILNVVSMAAFSATALLTDYSASKSGALGFCESLREELFIAGHKGIHISALCPYFVSTGLVEFNDRLKLALGPHDTAMTAVDGMLRNQELIFSPPVMWFSSKITALVPRKTAQFMKLKTGSAIIEKYSKTVKD